jgi:hypothetical protein
LSLSLSLTFAFHFLNPLGIRSDATFGRIFCAMDVHVQGLNFFFDVPVQGLNFIGEFIDAV